MVKRFQPESNDQSLDVNALIWKGLGNFVVLKFKRTDARTSCTLVLDKVFSLKTCQLAIAPTPRNAVSNLLYSVEKVPTLIR